jgi:hypothetical protein
MCMVCHGNNSNYVLVLHGNYLNNWICWVFYYLGYNTNSEFAETAVCFFFVPHFSTLLKYYAGHIKKTQICVVTSVCNIIMRDTSLLIIM